MTTISQWKEYLKANNLYHSDDLSPEINDEFKLAMINLESTLSNDIPSIKNLLWQNNQPNPNISLEDYQNAIKLLNIKKQKQSKAQANMDDLGPPPNREDLPLATKFLQTGDDSKLATGDPDTAQHQGVMNNKIPAKKPSEIKIQNKPNNNSINKRMLELEKLLEK